MQDKTLILDAPGIAVPIPKNFVFHDEGYMQPYDFYNKVCRTAHGRDLTFLEIQNLNMGADFGAYDSYIKIENGVRIRHMHIYLAESIKTKRPLNVFVRGHEQTHILKPEFVNGYSLLKDRLTHLNIGTSNFGELVSEDEFAHVGGLVSLRALGISVGEESSEDWRLFLNQCGDLASTGEFKKSLEWFVKSARI